MQAHEKRVVTEKRELDEKLEKLKAFCFSPGSPIFRGLDPVDRGLLEFQYTTMEIYLKILERRIRRFQAASKSG
jgi:hypothetical protein